MKKFNIVQKLNMFLFILLIVSFSLRVYYSDKMSLAGGELSNDEQELLVTVKDNEHLKSELLQYKSLSVLYDKAYQNGYIDSKVEYFESPGIAAR